MRSKIWRRRFVSLVAVAVCGYVSAADIQVTGPITSGINGVPFSAPTVDVVARGYVVEEFFLEGEDGQSDCNRSVNYQVLSL